MTENEYHSPIWDKQPICPTPNIGLSLALTYHDYDAYMKTFEYEVRKNNNTIEVEHINIICEGQCPKGCEKKFKLKLGKSLTKKSFEKIYNHAKKYPQHCINCNYIGVVKNNDQ